MRTTVVCKCKAQMRRRVTSNLSNMWLGLVTVLELSGGVRCVARVFVNLQFGRTCVPRQSQPLRLVGTVMRSQNSVLGKRRLFRATALNRPGVVIVARTCKSKHVPTSRLLEAGKQYSSLGTEAVKRSTWLRVVRHVNRTPSHVTFSRVFSALITVSHMAQGVLRTSFHLIPCFMSGAKKAERVRK